MQLNSIWGIPIDLIEYILMGLKISLLLFGVTLLLSVPIGFLFATGKVVCKRAEKGKTSALTFAVYRIVGFLLDIYTWVIRGTPLMLQLFFAFYGLPMIYGFRWDDLTFIDGRLLAAFCTFTVNYAAYFTEIFRAGILSVDKGQFEAAKALGMTYPQTMRRIVIPQAIKRALPPMGNEFITLVKDTALGMVIAIPEIMLNTKKMAASYVEPKAYFIAAAIFLILTYGIVLFFKIVEKKLDYYD